MDAIHNFPFVPTYQSAQIVVQIVVQIVIPVEASIQVQGHVKALECHYQDRYLKPLAQYQKQKEEKVTFLHVYSGHINH